MSDPAPRVGDMIIDCGTCKMAELACGDCVVSVLLGPVGGAITLDSEHEQALLALADSGLVPPLRLVSGG